MNRHAIVLVVAIITSITAVGCCRKKRPVATVLVGAAAKLVASSYFLGNRPEPVSLDKLLEDEMFLGKLFHSSIKVRLTEDEQGVVASAWGIERTARYRPGFGVTLVPNIPGYVLSPPELIIPPAPKPTPLPEEELPEPYRSKMNDFLDWAFEKVPPGDCRRTRAVVVVQGGTIIAERYAPGFNEKTRLLSWSMAKSVVNALVGILVHRGQLHLHEPAPVAEWHEDPNDPRAEITINQLLQMNSGIDFPDSIQQSTTQMLFDEVNMAHYYATRKLGHEPGTQHFYANGAAVLLARVAQERVGAVNGHLFPYRELFHKIGMTTARFEVDPEGTFVGSSYIYATAREWARFGLLYLNNGQWKGEQILPKWWVHYTRESAPYSSHGEYGAFFWTNDHDAWRHLPEDCYEATGWEGQLVAIIPSRQLVAVRMGHSLLHGWHHEKFLERLLRALPPKPVKRHVFTTKAQRLLREIKERQAARQR